MNGVCLGVYLCLTDRRADAPDAHTTREGRRGELYSSTVLFGM